ncbi:hypothetical protein D3C72_1717250 [compost metagenome]
MTDLAGLHQFSERLQLFGDFGKRALLVLTGGVEAPGAAEMIGAAIRPVNLVEVDVVGLQPLEAGIHRLADGGGVDIATAANIISPGAGDLGGEHDLIAPAGLFEPAADILLGPALCFGGNGGGRIKLGRIEEIDAVFDGVVHLLMGFCFGVLRAPRHGAEADFGHGDARASQ